MNDQPQHATLQLQRSYPAPVEQVFSEFADPVARARWSPSGGDSLVYDEADFRAGGRDIFRCGPAGDLKFRGETRYLVIVPNVRVVSSECVDVNGQCLAVSLSTLEFSPGAHGTDLTLTVQMVSFAGAGMIAGYESGNRSALENLASHLEQLT